jgi:hypothetical protein
MEVDAQQTPWVPNGLVGDWRLSDTDFIASFRLPGAAEKVNLLEARNPLLRDSRIVFEEEAHRYYIDGRVRAPRSVTQLVHECAQEFNAPVAIAAMRRGRNWSRRRVEFLRPDGEEMTEEEIAAKWAENGRVQSSRGTLMHFQIEQFLNDAVIEQPHSPEFAMFLRFREDFMLARGLKPLRTELSLFHCGLRMAGQVDLIARDCETGRLVILDWKRSKEIKFKNPYQKLKPPLDHLDDCNYNLYCLQLNIYRYMLQTEYGEPVSGMYLAVFHPNEVGPLCVEVPRLDREVNLLVEHAKREHGAGDPVPGEDAPFMGSVPDPPGSLVERMEKQAAALFGGPRLGTPLGTHLGVSLLSSTEPSASSKPARCV